MTVKHNYLNVAGKKPKATDIVPHEIVVNEADATLWSKTAGGAVKKLADDSALVVAHEAKMSAQNVAGHSRMWLSGTTLNITT